MYDNNLNQSDWAAHKHHAQHRAELTRQARNHEMAATRKPNRRAPLKNIMQIARRSLTSTPYAERPAQAEATA